MHTNSLVHVFSVNLQESARVRTFGLLTGSLDPESHACSLQGIDFFMLVLVILFNGTNSSILHSNHF